MSLPFWLFVDYEQILNNFKLLLINIINFIDKVNQIIKHFLTQNARISFYGTLITQPGQARAKKMLDR